MACMKTSELDVSAGPHIDGATFRSIMSAFPTGVTVITTTATDGTYKGFTSNAVTSVSLTPPMLLVCVALTSETLPVLREAKRFVVNFLKSGEHEVSNRFARKGADKFDGVSCDSDDGLPVLREHTIAHAVCATEFEVEAGDHIVLIGRVLTGDAIQGKTQPLLYYQSGYPSWPSQ
jgi:flavin reductase (DIM6/NTAB) family NADH-FMN oxidoreductase RutF